MTRRNRTIALVSIAAALALLIVSLGSTGCGYIRAWRARCEIWDEMFTPREFPPSRLDVNANIPILHLYGTPEEMGRQYGTVMGRALRALETYMCSLLPTRTINAFRKFAGAIEPNLPGDIRNELRAVADASGVPYLDLVTMNVIPRARCSTLAVWGEATGGRPLLLGRNAEYSAFGLSDRGGLVVVRHPAKGIPTVSVTFLGLAGAFTGINRNGVAFANLLVFNARDDEVRTDGVPIQIALRVAAEQAETADAMAALLRARKPMIPMNVALADAKQALVLELGLFASEIRGGERGVLAATNFFRTPRLSAMPVACERYDSLVAAARARDGRFDVAAMKNALHAARLKNLNIQAVICEPATMTMHLSINREPASAGPYTTFDLRELLAEAPPLVATSGVRDHPDR